MSVLNCIKNIFGKTEQTSATTAKERLQIIISNERRKRDTLDFLPNLQLDLIQVISKYFNVDEEKIKEQVKVDLENRDDGQSVLELNITLPEASLAEAETA